MPLIVMLSAADTLLIALILGLAVCFSLLLPAVGLVCDVTVRQRSCRLGDAGLFGLWATTLGILLTRTAAMSGQPLVSAFRWVPITVTQTHYGGVWLVRVFALALCSLFWLGRRTSTPERTTGYGLIAGVAVLAAARSASGHAGANGDWTLHELVDWCHFLCAALWGGGVLASALLVNPRLSVVPAAGVARFTHRFSTIAAFGLAGVVVTGIANAWYMLPTPRALDSSTYGQLLDLKLLLVGAMTLCGAINRFWIVPKLTRASNRQVTTLIHFRHVILFESVVFIAIVASASALTQTMPPS